MMQQGSRELQLTAKHCSKDMLLISSPLLLCIHSTPQPELCLSPSSLPWRNFPWWCRSSISPSKSPNQPDEWTNFSTSVILIALNLPGWNPHMPSPLEGGGEGGGGCVERLCKTERWGAGLRRAIDGGCGRGKGQSVGHLTSGRIERHECEFLRGVWTRPRIICMCTDYPT